MSRLKDVNVEKSLAIFKDFYNAVAVPAVNPLLQEKKKQAGAALAHLDKLLLAGSGQPEPGKVDGCSGCAQNDSTGANCSNNSRAQS